MTREEVFQEITRHGRRYTKKVLWTNIEAIRKKGVLHERRESTINDWLVIQPRSIWVVGYDAGIEHYDGVEVSGVAVPYRKDLDEAIIKLVATEPIEKGRRNSYASARQK